MFAKKSGILYTLAGLAGFKTNPIFENLKVINQHHPSSKSFFSSEESAPLQAADIVMIRIIHFVFSNIWLLLMFLRITRFYPLIIAVNLMICGWPHSS